MDNFWTLIGRGSNIISIFGAIASIWLWFRMKYQLKKIRENAAQDLRDNSFREMHNYHQNINTTNPFVVCFELKGKNSSIRNDVDVFLKGKNISIIKNNFLEIKYDTLTKESFIDFVEELIQKRIDLKILGATEILVFLEGPLQAAALIGSVFSNWVPVKIYNLEPQSRRYEYWGFLTK